MTKVQTASYVVAMDGHRDGTLGTYYLGNPPASLGDLPGVWPWGSIRFQDGPLAEVGGRNGAFIEEILEGVILHRLRQLNEKFPCRENSLAITNIEQGLLWLNRRTELRHRQDVEGRNVAHSS